MKRLALIFMAAAALCAVAQTQKHSVKVGDFTQLRVVDNINVVYHQCNADSTGTAVFEAAREMVPVVMFNNNSKGKLSIQVDPDRQTEQNLPVVHVYSQYLMEAENAGDSTLTIISIAPTPEFKLRLTDNGFVDAKNINCTTANVSIYTGNGTLMVEGSCTKANIKNVGVGQIQADRLIAKNVSCNVAGTGHVGCYVDGGKLDVKGMGTGKVYYRGKPSEVKVFKLGGVEAIPLDE
mgnify:CR=1 FL=1